MNTIIRDFAYGSLDARHQGIFTATVLSPTSSTTSEKIDEEVEGEEDGFKWNYNMTRASSTSRPATKHKTILTKASLVAVIANLNTALTEYGDDTLKISLVRVVFPFVKGMEYEMALEMSEELLIVELDNVIKTTPNSDPGLELNSEQKERWSSIDDSLDTAADTSISVKIDLEPILGDFYKEIKVFLECNRKYGDGWKTALKVKIKGEDSTGVRLVKLEMVDIGLVPKSYIKDI